MKARSYREFLTRKWVAMGILSFLTLFMTSCGDSASIGEAPPAADSDFTSEASSPPDSDFIGEASSPPDQDVQSQESPLEPEESNQCDTSHCDLIPQEINDNGILAIGDSVTAWFNDFYTDCCQSYSDYASIEIGEYIQNEARSGTMLGWGIPIFLPSIPYQYAKATAANGPYDVVVLTGGGNDLRQCLPTRQSCTERCGGKMEQVIKDMETLVARIVRDGSDVILVGYYPFYHSAPVAWYNECVAEMDSRYQEIAESSSHVTFVSTTDLANPNDPSDYDDGLHPSIALAKRIGERVADAF